MALTLYVAPAWRSQVREVWDAHPGVVPVVKGNGYGFGRQRLFRICADVGVDLVAVGTIHELGGAPASTLVLTPLSGAEVGLIDETPSETVFTVSSVHQALAIAGRRRAVVKLNSVLGRYGASTAERHEIEAVLGAAIVGYSLHLPLDGGHLDAADLPDGATLFVSHLPTTPRISGLRVRQRIGTRLWLGDKSNLRLRADVVEVREVHEGDIAGYHRTAVAGEGTLVMVSVGSSHGVAMLPEGLSPFHFARHRLAVHETPHMHTTMLWVPVHLPCPRPGDEVDVQQPLTRVWPDRVVW